MKWQLRKKPTWCALAGRFFARAPINELNRVGLSEAQHESRESIKEAYKVNWWNRVVDYFYLNEETADGVDIEEDEEFVDPYDKPTVRKLGRGGGRGRRDEVASVRSLASVSAGNIIKVHLIEPRRYNEAQVIADKFKSSVPVIMNLQHTDVELSKRLLDFASGLAYALEGGMQKIADKVFLLTPSNVEVSPEEKRKWQEKGFFKSP